MAFRILDGHSFGGYAVANDKKFAVKLVSAQSDVYLSLSSEELSLHEPNRKRAAPGAVKVDEAVEIEYVFSSSESSFSEYEAPESKLPCKVRHGSVIRFTRCAEDRTKYSINEAIGKGVLNSTAFRVTDSLEYAVVLGFTPGCVYFQSYNFFADDGSANDADIVAFEERGSLCMDRFISEGTVEVVGEDESVHGYKRLWIPVLFSPHLYNEGTAGNPILLSPPILIAKDLAHARFHVELNKNYMVDISEAQKGVKVRILGLALHILWVEILYEEKYGEPSFSNFCVPLVGAHDSANLLRRYNIRDCPISRSPSREDSALTVGSLPYVVDGRNGNSKVFVKGPFGVTMECDTNIDHLQKHFGVAHADRLVGKDGDFKGKTVEVIGLTRNPLSLHEANGSNKTKLNYVLVVLVDNETRGTVLENIHDTESLKAFFQKVSGTHLPPPALPFEAPLPNREAAKSAWASSSSEGSEGVPEVPEAEDHSKKVHFSPGAEDSATTLSETPSFSPQQQQEDSPSPSYKNEISEDKDPSLAPTSFGGTPLADDLRSADVEMEDEAHRHHESSSETTGNGSASSPFLQFLKAYALYNLQKGETRNDDIFFDLSAILNYYKTRGSCVTNLVQCQKMYLLAQRHLKENPQLYPSRRMSDLYVDEVVALLSSMNS
ncbi:hypothetical protein AGDE_14055 [Angomonas deanei]|uniref:Uncharacterized protein n=1 Tax=Angomonas deanei TaxID=59799 RepID=A0A7G2CJY7_9TRYP|nr:hypothetical protein AGDE_14055 [Angomonas deanei]CAD2219709.1 hypothetical protein, conserved [Angomonas deanei]|eukprot:EPY21502.1 hypothetical protein AGDE_14055 [Angomonas deanei]